MEPNQYPGRKTTRLCDYDYSKSGFYFITICTQDHWKVFGEIVDGEMRLNAVGEMVKRWWQRLEERYDVQLDCHVVMPNHFHGIVVIPDEGTGAHIGEGTGAHIGEGTGAHIGEGTGAHIGEGTGAHTGEGTGAHTGAPLQQIVRWFKTMTTNEYIRGVKEHQWKPFDKRLWQRNYYEHVIRGDKDLAAIREYIVNNPLKWALDRENPDNFNHQKAQNAAP